MSFTAMAFNFPKLELPSSSFVSVSAGSESIRVGMEAPDVQLTSIDGETIRLADHEGKNVVVLDFWASWCGPCRVALPKVNELADLFAETNVAFYAVNVMEDADTARMAMEELKVSLPLAMDANGTLGDAFGVEGIPHTVIIGLDGVIRAVHSGFGPGMDNQLIAELNAALAGEQVVPVPYVEATIPQGYTAQSFPCGDQIRTWMDLQELFATVLKRDMEAVLRACPSAETIPLAELEAFVFRAAEGECREMLTEHQSISYKRNRKYYEELSAQIDAWDKQGVEHPVLSYVGLLAGRGMADKARQLKRAARGLELLDANEVSAPWLRFEMLEVMSRHAPSSDERKIWRGKAKTAFSAAFNRDLYAPGEERVLSYRMTDKLDNFFSKKEWRQMADQLVQDENVPQFLQLLADGYAHAEEAWDARGSGWGSSVTQAGWMGFAEHLGAARKALTAVWEAQPMLPEAPVKMIMVSMGKSIERNEERKWFDRAITAQFDLDSAYRQLAWALTPRWGGSLSQLQSLAHECLAVDRYDTKVPVMYYHCAKNMILDARLEPVNFRRAGELARLKNMVDQYKMAGSFDEHSMAAIITFVAAGASLGGDDAMAYELLKSINFKVDPALTPADMGVKSWRNYIVSAGLNGGAVVEENKAKEALWAEGRLDDVVAVIDRMLENQTIPDAARERLWIELDSIGVEKVPANEWVTVFKQGEDVAWVSGKNTYWAQDEEGRLRVAAYGMGLGWIPGRVSLVDGFELEFVLDRVDSNKVSSERAVIFFARPEWHQYLPLNARFMFKDQKVLIDRGYNDGEEKVDCVLAGSNQVRIAVKDGKMTIGVNGSTVLTDYAVPSSGRYAESLWIGIGDYWSGRFRNNYRYSNIRLKRLN